MSRPTTAAAALIVLERAYCASLRFDLRVEAPSKRARLALSGPPGTREFLATWLEPYATRAERAGGAQ